MPKCDFNIALKRGFSSVNLLHFFRTPFPKNTSGRLLLFGKLINCLLTILLKSVTVAKSG